MIKDMVLVNGELFTHEEAKVNFNDRGLQFGDGIFEVVPVYNGKCFALLPHMESFFESVIAIKIPGIYMVEELVEFHEELIKETGLVNGKIYTQITRGSGEFTLSYPEMMIPQLTMFAIEEDRKDLHKLQEEGVHVITQPDVRWERCDINSLNRLPEVMAKQKAKEGRFFDAVFVRDGKITEATESNLMIVKDGIIWTHPANNLIHHTITGRLVTERLVKDIEDMQVVEKAFTVDFAVSAEEVFLVGPSCEIVPVTKIDKKFIGNRTPGEVTKKLQEAFRSFVLHECPIK